LSTSWAVFLDRDGTLNEYAGLVANPGQLRLIPGVGSALRKLSQAGAKLLLVTNQPVVARALVDEQGLAAIHDRLQALLAVDGAALDGIFYCPHHPETHHPEAADPHYRRDCDCRKPKPGMLYAAASQFGIDLQASYMVGDSTRDIAAANAAGCVSILVRTGSAGQDGTCPDATADIVVDNLPAAADWILEHRSNV